MKQFKRVMAMLLCFVMTLGLFAGLTLPASAAGTQTYTKITSVSDIKTDGTKYLVVAADGARYFKGSLTGTSLDSTSNYGTFSSSLGTGTASFTGDYEAETVTIESGYYMKTASGYYIGRSTNSNGLTSATSKSSNYVLTITASSGQFTVKGTVARYLSYNASSGRFRFFSSGTVMLYEMSTSAATLESISLGGTYTTTFPQGGTFNHTGMTVTAHYSDSTTADVTGSASWSSPDMSTAGSKTVTVTYSGKTATYTITVQATPTHTLGSSVSPSGGGSVSLSASTVAEGATATATATPAAGYDFTSWSISGTGASLSSTTANPTTVTMGTANATVTANFTAKTPAGALTLSEAGNTTADTISVSGKYVGDTVTLPDDPANYPTDTDYDTFIGWYAGSYSNETTAPSDGSFYAPGAPYTLTGSAVTLKAVYAKSTTGESETRWKLATSVPSTSTTVILAGKDSSGNYYAMNSGSTSSVTYVTCAAITVADGMIDKDTTTTNYEFTFNPSDPSFTNAASGKLVLNASSLRINTGNANPPTSVTIDANGYTQIHRSTNTKYVVFAGSSNGFGQSGTAASSATTAVYMFTQQEVGGTTYGYYETDFVVLYDIVLSANPSGQGTVTAKIGGTGDNVTKAAAGDEVYLYVTPASHYHFDTTNGWYGMDGGGDDLTITSYTTQNGAHFTMPAMHVEIEANLALDTHTLTVNSDHGTVAKEVGGSSTNLSTFDYGTTVTLTATPTSPYIFDSWTVVGTSNYLADGNEIVVTMDANVTVTANYVDGTVPTYESAIDVVPDIAVSTTGVTTSALPANAEANETVTLSISNLPAHYHFVQWRVTDLSDNTVTVTNPTSASGATFAMPTGGALVYADIAKDTHTLTITSDYGTVECDTTGDLVENDTDTFTYYYGTEELLTATADSGYVFTGWTVSGVTPEDQSDNVLDLILTANATVTANYAKVQQLSVASVANVTITATPAGGSAVAEGSNANPQVGTTVTLNYSALDSAYNWTSWNVYKTGDSSTTVSVTGSGSGATFTMPAYDVTVSATVTERATYTVQFSINGSLGDIEDATPYQGDSITLPTPSTNSDIPSSVSATYTYNTFVGWTTAEITDETSTAPTIYTGSYTPTGNVTLYALYSRNASGGGGSGYTLVSDQAGLTEGRYLIVSVDDSLAFDGSRATLDGGQNGFAVTISSNTIADDSTTEGKYFDLTVDGSAWTITSASGGHVAHSGTSNGMNGTGTNTISISSGVATITGSGGKILCYNSTSGTSNERFRYYTSASGSNHAVSLFKKGAGSTTYYVTAPVAAATWEISYNGNGADSGVPETHYIIQGQTGSVASGTPVRAGYEFAGWYDSVNDATYDPGDPITPDDDVVLVAQWTPVYTVTFDSDGGSAVASQSVVSGGIATEPTAPTKPGYAFSGWTLSGSAYNFSTAVTGNITLTATWTGYTWTIYDNGSSVGSGNGPTTLPSAPSGTITNDGHTYTFYKWGVVATDISSPTTTAPTAMYDAGASFTPTANGTIIRAVYTYDAEGGGGGGTEPDAAFAAGDTGTYVIAVDTGSGYIGLPNNPTVSSGKIAADLTGNAVTVSETTGGIKYVTNANASGYKWTIASDGNGYYTIEDAGNTGNYIYHSNGGASGTNLGYGSTASYSWSFTVDSGAAVQMAGVASSTVNGRGILYQAGSVNKFGGYALSNWSANDYYKTVILPIGGAGSTTTNYLTLGSVVLNDDVVLLTYGQGAVTINVKANDVGVGDGDTVALDDTYEGFSVVSNNVVFDPAAVTGGFKTALTATYTIGSYSADVTVKPAERIFYEESSSLFTFADGKRGAWTTLTGTGTTTQTLAGSDGQWRTADDTAYASLTYSGGSAKSVTVGSTVTNGSASSTWPYVEFTFAGTGFEAISTVSNTTGTLLYEVHQGDSVSGALVGKKVIVDTYQGASYDGAEWQQTGTSVTYHQIPIIKIDNLTYGTYTVRISASYASAYDHAAAGSYTLNFDGVRIFNPLNETAPYLYRSFRDAIVNADSLGTIPASTNVSATFYIDGVASSAHAQSAAAGTSITLPTLTDSDLASFDLKTYHFYGWLVGTDLDNDTTTAPSGANFLTGGSSYTLSSDTSFYAVCYYDETGSGNGGDYVKLMSGDEITSGVYLIVCEGDEYAISKAFDGSRGTDNIDAADNNISVTIDTTGATPKIASTNTVDASSFTIDAATGTIYSSGGTYIGQSSDANGMLHTANGNYANDITIDSSNNAVIIGSGNAHLRFNNGSSDQRFRYYKSSTYSAQTAIQLYKKEGATATTYVTDLLEIIPQSITLSGSGTLNGSAQTVSNGGTITMMVGETINVTATLATTTRKATTLAWSSSPAGKVTIGGSGNTRSINGTAVGTTVITVVCTGDNTIRASFTVNVVASATRYAYTVNLYENSTAVTPLEVTGQTEGTYTFTLPDSVTAANTPTGYTFAGWVEAEHTGQNSYSGTSAGLSTSTGYIAPGGEYEVTGVADGTATATLYALYTKSESVSASSNATYQMVTSDAFTTTDTYVMAALKDSRFYFVNGTATGGSLGVESTGLAQTSLTGNTTFVASSLPSGSKELKVTAASGAKGIYYTVYDEDLAADVDYYLYATGSAQSLAWSSDNTAETFTPDFSVNSTDGCVMTGSSGSKVSYNSSVTDKTKFIRNYASTGSFYTDLYFFKYVEGSGSGYVTNYYYTTGTSSNSGGSGGAEGRGLTQSQVDALYTSTSQTLTVGGVSKTGFSNWGSRGEWSTFLTTPANDYYTGTYAIDVLLGNSGGTSVSNFASSDLFTVLHSMLTSKHTTHGSYDAAKPILGLADCVENDTTTVSSLYDGTLIATGDFGVSGTGWNREHCWPQSKLSATNAKNDPYLLRAEGQTTNSARGNTAYGKSSSYYYPNLTSTYDVRGDVARIVLYVYTEYQESLLWGSSGVFENLDVMYEWMVADPVDTWEMGRNDVVQQFTGVRNPYVDYPELFFALFGYSIPANYRTPSAYYTSATNPATAFSGSAAPSTGTDETLPIGGNSVGGGAQVRALSRNVAQGNITGVTAAVMVNGMGGVNDVENYLDYGPKNELYLAQGNAIIVYVSGRATEVAVGAKALAGAASGLSVYTINGDDSLTSVLTGATENVVSVASANERYYPIDVSAIYDSGTHAERSKILLIYNPNTNPVSLTNLRVNSSSNATLAISTGSVTRGIRAVKSLLNGTAIITDAPEATAGETRIIGTSLSLNGTVDVNFILEFNGDVLDEGVYATIDGERAAIGASASGYYVSKPMPAKNIGDEVTLRLYHADGSVCSFYSGEDEVTEVRYSGMDYVDYVISNNGVAGLSSEKKAELVALCKALSDYNRFAMIQQNYKVAEAQARPIYNQDALSAVDPDAIANNVSVSYTGSGVQFYGASLMMLGDTSIRFYVKLSGDGSFTATVNGKPAELVQNGQLYYVEAANIAAKDLGTAPEIVVTDGVNSVTITGYSAYTYVKQTANGSDSALANVARAIKVYGDAAAKYFGEASGN